MHFSSMVEIVAACHLTRYVESPFQSRGGIIFAAPPGALKTTLIEILDEFPTAKVLSDINVQSMIRLREDIVSGNIATIAFTDMEKLYKRHSSVASNLEGIIMALAEEGFRKASFAEQRMVALPARCAIIGGITLKFYEQKIGDWLDNGFARRFLWSQFHLKNPEVLEDAISAWKKHELDGSYSFRQPANSKIPYSLNPSEVDHVHHSLRFQTTRQTPFILAQKLLCVLKWKFERKEPGRAWKIYNDFAVSLGKNGAELNLDKTNA